MIIEITYSRTVSPSEVDDDPNDHRNICVGFKKITLDGHTINFRKSSLDNPAFKIFGFYDPEEWGTWSQGKKSCLYIPHYQIDKDELVLHIDAIPYRKAFASCVLNIASSSGHFGSAAIHGYWPTKVKLKKKNVMIK
jgi:hypothetical protein